VTTVSREVRQDVADVLVAYATGIDRRDWDLFRRCFTDDCEADYGEIGAWHGVDEITEWMRQTHEPCGHTLHSISNVAVTASDGRTLWRRSHTDGSYGSARDPRVLVGLGDAAGPVKVRIISPDGKVEEKSNVAIDRYTDLR